MELAPDEVADVGVDTTSIYYLTTPLGTKKTNNYIPIGRKTSCSTKEDTLHPVTYINHDATGTVDPSVEYSKS